MLVKNEDNYGYREAWRDVLVDEYEGYHPIMTDFHFHDFYEISLIFSGDMGIYLPSVERVGIFTGLVLSPRGTPHYITCTEKALYKRTNVVFSEEFIAEGIKGYEEILKIFSKSGNIIETDTETAERLLITIKKTEREENRFRKRLLLLYLLSEISELSKMDKETDVPDFLSRALSYINENYREKIVAENLAHKVGVGRTTLMNSFRKHLGLSFSEYVAKCRLFSAVNLLKSGKSVSETAELSGFTESSNFIRSFKKYFGQTPAKYLGNIAGD